MNGMTPVAVRPRTDTPENHFQLLHFRTIRPILMSELPTAHRQSKSSELRNLEVVKDFNQLLEHVRDGIVSPVEVAGELDLSGHDVQALRGKKKSFISALRALLKACIKDHGLSEKIRLAERDHSTRLFVMGRA